MSSRAVAPSEAAKGTDVAAALGRFLERYVEACWRDLGSLPRQPHDPAWPSPCQVGSADADGIIRWEPVARDSPADFSGLERALEVAIHPDVVAFYGRYWCDSIAARTDEGALTLIQVWNPEDFDRLLANLIGHALAKRRARLPLTIFIATTDEDDLMLSIGNASGAVVLETPGSEPIREVAPCIADFLDQVTPLARLS